LLLKKALSKLQVNFNLLFALFNTNIGYDLSSNEAKTVPAKGKALITTGISVAIPEGNYGRIAPRSGLAWKNFIDVGAGVIDEDYRGELKV